MAANEPIDPRVRLAISQWPADAPRGAVSTFCVEHGISRKSFYELRRRTREEGPAAVLEPKSKRPGTSPTKLSEDVKKQAVAVRAALEASGLDHGPISVHDKMRAMGMPVVPSIAALGRIFRESGVARTEPKKKPRSSWRRFVYPAPNACWQLDATEYVLTRGRTCVIFQLIDDHSRYAVASHVAWGEKAKDAIAVFDKAVAAHGVPQRLLSDNGSALNPSRRGFLGQLVAHVAEVGVTPMTGKPYKPTTQGKNERFHQTLFRYLDKQPLAEDLAELQAQVDAFDLIYNNERPHQGLPGRVTPQSAWLATPKADPPRPQPDRPIFEPSQPVRRPRPTVPENLDPDTKIRTVTSGGTIGVDRVVYKLDVAHAFKQVLVISNGTDPGDTLTITDLDGEILAELTRPPAGSSYVGNGRRPGQRTRPPEVSPKS